MYYSCKPIKTTINKKEAFIIHGTYFIILKNRIKLTISNNSFYIPLDGTEYKFEEHFMLSEVDYSKMADILIKHGIILLISNMISRPIYILGEEIINKCYSKIRLYKTKTNRTIIANGNSLFNYFYPGNNYSIELSDECVKCINNKLNHACLSCKFNSSLKII